MHYHLDGYGRYLEVTGYRNISFAKAEEFLKPNRAKPQAVEIQFFDADTIATSEHLYFAVLNAQSAFKAKTNVSKSIAMETMLYASAQRQIQRAIERCGIKPQTTRMAVIVLGDDPVQVEAMVQAVTEAVRQKPDESVLEINSAKKERLRQIFQITAEEEQTVTRGGASEKAIVDLVIERVALVATQL